MKRQVIRPKFLVLLAVCAAVFSALAGAGLSVVSTAHAAVPNIVNYQGTLANASGTALGGAAGQNFDFKFSIWDAATGGTRLWPTATPSTTTLMVTNGVFNAALGDTTLGFPALDLDFNSATPYYLQIEVYNATSSTFETLSPRQPIDSVGFALNAAALNGFTEGTSSNNLLQLDADGNINIAGGATFGSSTLIVDSASSTVSVGTAYAGFMFNVGGGAYVQDTLNASTIEFRSGGDEITGLGSDGINFQQSNGGDLAHLSSQGLSILAGPQAIATSSVLQLGPNALATDAFTGASGTYIGINSTGTADFITFQKNSSTKFSVDSGGNEYIAGSFTANSIGANYMDFASEWGTRITRTDSLNGIDFQVGNFDNLAYFTPSGINVALLPPESTTSSLLQFGSNALSSGNASGTLIGANSTSSADFLNFQNNSTTEFKVDKNGMVTGNGGLKISGTTYNSSYINFQSTNNLIQLEGTDYDNTPEYIFATAGSGATLQHDSESTGVFGGWNFAPTFEAHTSASTTGSFQEIGFNIAPNFGAGATYEWDSSKPMLGLQVAPTIDVNTNSTGGYTALLVNPTETSVGAAAKNYLVQFQTGGVDEVDIASNGTARILAAPPASASSSLLQLGGNALAGGNASGTYIGINSTSSADFLNFQNNSTTVFQVANTSTANVDLYIGPNALSSTNASGTTIAENQSSPFNGDFINFEVNSSTVFGVDSAGKVTGVGGFSGECLSSGSFASSSADACNMDVAESYPTYEPTAAGDVVAIPPAGSQTFDSATSMIAVGKSHGTAGETVLGVVSTNPGLVFDNGNTLLAGKNDDMITSSKTLIALAGRVPVNVSLENGPIAAGDLLAPSPTIAGAAARAVAPGMVIGTALQSFGDASNTSSTGQILVFVNPHWSLGNLTVESEIASSSWALATSSPSVLDQFTLYIKYGLNKLGIAISNGVATIDQLFAKKVTTDELCVGTTCVDQSQLQQLLQNNNTDNFSIANPTPPPDTSTSTATSTATSTVDMASSTPTSTLNIVLNVNNAQGGTAAPSDFTLSIIAGHPSSASFAGNASGTAVTIDAATAFYTNVPSAANYTAGYDSNGDCNDKDGAIAGATVTCSITETYNAPVATSTSTATSTLDTDIDTSTSTASSTNS